MENVNWKEQTLCGVFENNIIFQQVNFAKNLAQKLWVIIESAGN